MTKILDIRLHSSGSVDAIRRVEYVVLLIFSAASVLMFSHYGPVIALPLSLLALMLVPTRCNPAKSHAERRLATLNEIQDEGLRLRSQWLYFSESQGAQSALDRWSIRRETILWMYRCERSLKPFPEVAGIFEAHEARDDLMEDLDSCLAMLSRLRRLVSLSKNLKLPI